MHNYKMPQHAHTFNNSSTATPPHTLHSQVGTLCFLPCGSIVELTTFELVHAGACAPECLLEGVPGEACIPASLQPQQPVQSTSVYAHRVLSDNTLGSKVDSSTGGRPVREHLQSVWQDVQQYSAHGVVVAAIVVIAGAAGMLLLKTRGSEEEHQGLLR